MDIESKIRNSNLLANVFGRFPSFHDAEVLRVILDRDGVEPFTPCLEATIHVFEMTKQIDDRGRYISKNHVAVTFRFFNVRRPVLEDFNYQNVLQDLSIIDISDQQIKKINFEVSFIGIFGLSAKFQCDSISVETVVPYAYEPR